MKQKKSEISSSALRGGAKDSSRRKFLKQGLMFGAVAATYSVVSLTDLGCHSSTNPIGPNDYHLDYYGGHLKY
jgi:hypothetical protein